MQYAGLILNDTSNAGTGVCVSFYTQGCPHCCEGCHNPETWNSTGGYEFVPEVLNEILDGIKANGIKRNFCVLGGEPLCSSNLFLTYLVVKSVRDAYPDIKIYIWTGYTFEDLMKSTPPKLRDILLMSDVLIDGPYIQEMRDVTLPLRGSTNQRVINLKDAEVLSALEK
jgi:anaerobic ribonucleoside-triphosphate reductase activating protein